MLPGLVGQGFQVSTRFEDEIANHDNRRWSRRWGMNRHEEDGNTASITCRHRRSQDPDKAPKRARHRHRVFLWCLRIARNVEDAEDLTQDAFLLLCRKINTCRGESAFSTW